MWFTKNKHNEQARFEGFVDALAKDLTAFAVRLTGNREAGEDLVQETFIEAWKSFASLKDPGRARAWFFRILRRRYAASISAIKIQLIPSDENDGLDTVPSPQPNHGENLAGNDMINKALLTIHESFRLPLLMATIEGLTTAEIAEELGIPPGTVLSRIHRGREALRAALETFTREVETPQPKVIDITGGKTNANHG